MLRLFTIKKPEIVEVVKNLVLYIQKAAEQLQAGSHEEKARSILKFLKEIHSASIMQLVIKRLSPDSEFHTMKAHASAIPSTIIMSILKLIKFAILKMDMSSPKTIVRTMDNTVD